MSAELATGSFDVELDPLLDGMVDVLIERQGTHRSRDDLIEAALRSHLGIDQQSPVQISIELDPVMNLLLQTVVDDPESPYESLDALISAALDSEVKKSIMASDSHSKMQ